MQIKREGDYINRVHNLQFKKSILLDIIATHEFELTPESFVIYNCLIMKNIRFILICVLTVICLFSAVMLSACGSAVAANGDTVRVDYTLSLSDGTVYQTTVGKQPIEFVVGKGTMLADFEEAVIGMKVGESKTITIPSANAYGEHREDLVITIKRSQIQGGDNIEVGDYLTVTDSGGRTSQVKVIAVSGTDVTIDANHPLTGKDLIFKIDLLKVN
jgi:peptidylprolyl isomerase